MTLAWLRYDDRFTQRRCWDGVSYESRWHYKTLVEECSQGGRWDGRLTITRALRASDVPDPEGCLDELEAIGLVTVTRNAPVDNPTREDVVHRGVTRNRDATSAVTGDAVTVTVTQIDQHVPPPSIRDNNEKSALRMRRKRAHDRGEHHLCLPKNCPAAPAENGPQPKGVTRRVTRNPGTGLSQSSVPERSEGHPRTDTSSTDEQGRVDQSGLVGGPGGGVTRNAATPDPDQGADSNAVQDRKAVRVLTRDWPGVTEEIAAWIIQRVRADARGRGIPIRNLARYLARMQENRDLADYVGAALDHFDQLAAGTSPETTAESPPELRLIEDPRARRKAINDCARCDNNGMTLDDHPCRCDHAPPHSQPPLLQSVNDDEHDPRNTRPATGTDTDTAQEATTGVDHRPPEPPERSPDGSFDPPHQPPEPLTLQEARRILAALPEHDQAYCISRARIDLRTDGAQSGAVDDDQLVLAAAAVARRRMIA